MYNKIKITDELIGKTIDFGNNQFVKILSIVDHWVTYQSNNSGEYYVEGNEYHPAVCLVAKLQYDINETMPTIENIK